MFLLEILATLGVLAFIIGIIVHSFPEYMIIGLLLGILYPLMIQYHFRCCEIVELQERIENLENWTTEAIESDDDLTPRVTVSRSTQTPQ
jgi:hypothetical protein